MRIHERKPDNEPIADQVRSVSLGARGGALRQAVTVLLPGGPHRLSTKIQTQRYKRSRAPARAHAYTRVQMLTVHNRRLYTLTRSVDWQSHVATLTHVHTFREERERECNENESEAKCEPINRAVYLLSSLLVVCLVTGPSLI